MRVYFSETGTLGEGWLSCWGTRSVPGQSPRFYPGLIEGPSLFGQPLLPGTVVGEASMRGMEEANNVTAGFGPGTH